MGAIKKKIYILHGWAYETTKWSKFISLLKNKGYDPILLKIPGLTRDINKPWDIDDYVVWLNGELENEKKVILLGHSNGGRIAIAYSLKHEDKIAKLILIDSAGIRDESPKIKIKRFVFGIAARAGKHIPGTAAFKNLLYKTARESDYNKADPVMKKTMENLIKVDFRNYLVKINIPTILIWGEDDKATPLSDGKLMKLKIPNSKLHIVKNAQHSPQFTDSKKVVEIINSYI